MRVSSVREWPQVAFRLPRSATDSPGSPERALAANLRQDYPRILVGLVCPSLRLLELFSLLLLIRKLQRALHPRDDFRIRAARAARFEAVAVVIHALPSLLPNLLSSSRNYRSVF